MYSTYETEPDGIILCAWVIGLVLWIVVTIICYNHAEKKGQSGCLWAIVVFLFGLIGLVIFLIVMACVKAPATDSRGAYVARPGVYGGRPPPQSYQQKPRDISADTGFRDYELDDLIEDGKLNDARKYMNEMLQMAKDMGDDQGYQNYKQYETKISQAATRPGSRKKDWE